jgi:hypothetical protein
LVSGEDPTIGAGKKTLFIMTEIEIFMTKLEQNRRIAVLHLQKQTATQ